MKTYQSHKIVQAARIIFVPSLHNIPPSAVSVDINVEDDNGGYSRIAVQREWFERHNPHIGGYIVSYEDGYTSFSPADAFEKGNAPLLPGAVASEALLAKLFGFDSGDGKLPIMIAASWLKSKIACCKYELRTDRRTMLCALTMDNGATYLGESSCALGDEDGQEYAYKDALEKACGAYDFLLRQLRHMAGLA